MLKTMSNFGFKIKYIIIKLIMMLGIRNVNDKHTVHCAHKKLVCYLLHTLVCCF